MCRWGGVLSQNFYTKSAPVINFPVFPLDPIRPYLDWALRGTPDPFIIEIAAEMKTKCKIWVKCQFSHTIINCRKILNAPLDALMCPLPIINDIEPLSSTLHGVNACFIVQCPKLLDAISRKPINQNQVILDNLFLHLSANFEVKIQNLTFRHLKNRHLMAQQTAPRWDTQKSKIASP